MEIYLRLKNKISIFFSLLISSLLLLSCACSNSKTPQDIYNDAINYVVEVKSISNNTEAYGSGVIIDDNTIVTNAHMVSYKVNGEYQALDSFYIRYATSNDYQEVSLVKYDLELDLAILKSNDNVSKSSKLVICNSDNIQVGEECYAIGNALNQGISLTKGYISLKAVDIIYNDYTRRVIQSDLTINEGNSGGALINSKGELIGITTFRLKDNEGNIIYGLAYSIPINTVMSYLS